MKVCSFNVWSDAPRNARWAARREEVAEVLRGMAPEIAGLQETTLPMIRDLHERLAGYGWVGVGRDDGREAGEFTPIFFQTSKVSLIEHGSFWLAEDCETPGRGWDAAHSRIVTWACFTHRESGRRFVHFNTHLDHLGRKARRFGVLLLRQKIVAIAGADPVVITGDFNCRETSEPYRLLTGQMPFVDMPDTLLGLYDTFHRAEGPREGSKRTFLGILGWFGLGRIDYIFVNDGFRTLRHAVIETAVSASDHRPVLAELAFSSSAP